MLLLDTNIISELRKFNTNKIDKNVATWIKQQAVNQLYVTSITIFELEMGILRLQRKDARQAEHLRAWFDNKVLTAFAERILPFDDKVALVCAHLHVPNPKSERDAWIGATAKHHGMSIATRNTKDFEHMNVPIINPFEKS